MKSSVIDKYLRDWAEPEVAHLKHLINTLKIASTPAPTNAANQAEVVITVPAFDEHATWWQQYSDNLAHHKIWWIWVFNAPDNLVDRERYQQQAMAHQRIQRQLQNSLIAGPITLGHLTQNHRVLLVDRFSQPLPHRQGVGLARKIGNDLGLLLIHQGLIEKPWLLNTDADVTLPENLLTHEQTITRFNSTTLSAFQFGFEHISANPSYTESTWCYDQYLRYHYKGLCYAGSPYAYTTIGSLLAVAAPYYAAVRGFPKQAAGEDFYLMNKLRKLGSINTLSNPKITVSGRPSHRVPYGTGPTLSRWNGKSRHERRVWSPSVYCQLKDLLSHCRKHLIANDAASSGCIDSHNILAQMPKANAEILDALGFSQWLNRAKLNQPYKAHERPPQQRLQAFHDWFDGLKTQQFIRRMAEHHGHITIAEAAGYWQKQQTPSPTDNCPNTAFARPPMR
jgi:hypothetical protein